MKHKCWLVWGSHIVLTGVMWSISSNSFSEHHFMTSTALAQTIREDATLGSESSRVDRNAVIRSIPSDLIDRGARRGANLFHSFEQFDIPANRGAYFSNPTGVERIFSRVTGSDRSEINGRLGVIQEDQITLGNANLFFINPNGIVFGPNASLDVGGSFAATTANAIQFGDRGSFSASVPELPSELLTINPSAFLFSQVPTSSIVNNSVAFAGVSPSRNDPLLGLQVPDTQSLLLLGGNVILNGGGLNALGGRVEIGAVGGVGAVGLNTDNSLNFPNTLERADVALQNGSQVYVIAGNGGSATIHARNIEILQGSAILAGIGLRLGSATSQAGDIILDATEVTRIEQSSLLANFLDRAAENSASGNGGDIRITTGSLLVNDDADLNTSTLGRGNAGDVIITARNDVRFDRGGSANSLVGDGAEGTGGNVQISAGSVFVNGGARLDTNIVGVGRPGSPRRAGNVIINARDNVVFSGFSNQVPSGAESSVLRTSEGEGGSIEIATGSLFVTNGAILGSNVFGRGRTGNVNLNIRDTLVLDGGRPSRLTGIFRSIGARGQGEGGDIQINTGSLIARNRARIEARTIGQGSAGNIRITAQDRVSLDNSGVLSNVEAGASGQGGSIDIRTGTLSLINGAQLQADTLGTGNAGNVTLDADDRILLDDSAIFSGVGENAVGQGGDIRINTGVLSLLNTSELQADTSGIGNAGNVVINAGDRVSMGNRTAIFSRIDRRGRGQAGDIHINTGSLFLSDAAQLQSLTNGQGDAGDVVLDARDVISFENSSTAFSSVRENGIGQGGDIRINTGSLRLTGGSQLQAISLNQGIAGNIIIQARDSVFISGVSREGDLASGAFSRLGLTGVGRGGNIQINAESIQVTNEGQLSAITLGQGNAGNITLITGDLAVTGGAQLQAATFSRGNAGNILIDGRRRVSFDGASNRGFSIAASNVEATGRGQGGDIRIRAGTLSLTNGAALQVTTAGQGDAGNIVINTRNRTVLTNNGLISSSVERGAIGQGGNIHITAQTLRLADRSQLSASTSSQGDAGNVRLDVRDRVSLTGNRSAIFSSVEDTGVGRGGDIDINTGSLSLTAGAQLTASTEGRGNAGRVNLNARDHIFFGGVASSGQSSGIFTTTEGMAHGQGGDVTVNANSFRIGDGATVNAQTFNRFRGGDVTVNANAFEAVRGGQIITTTNANGQAGNIILNIANNVAISGIDSTYLARLERFGRDIVGNQGASSGLFASTAPGSRGNGGTISLNTTNLNLTNRAEISTQSQGAGRAGNIAIRASGLLRAVRSDIVTSAVTSSGGAIDITAGDIRLFNDSDIRTNVDQGGGSGGNITLTASSVIAFGDSDVLAFARDGQGGDIRFNTPAFFGENYQPTDLETNPITLDGNDRVDINASGAIAGVITLPDVTFIQNSLTELPDTTINPETLVANSCIARSREQDGSFVITGTGGLPVRPGDAAMSAYPTGTVHTIPQDNTTHESHLPWQLGDAIAEPQGVYHLSDGRLVMSRECP